ncbi:Metalloenzyme, LuxS/M16 peptidase-like protein [Aspergillus pseudoustus]|uniref:Presequence protease, mitochondrial n=1 Tax=Aspergillus pseudoustus TaxID=1810923 RepID=A0ABR4L109_9EURO
MLRSYLQSGRHRAPVLRQPICGRVLRSPSLLPWTQSRKLASASPVINLPEVGDRIHGFTVKEKKDVPELSLTAVRLRHDKTHADYLHIAKNDSNNVFGIGFKTNPPDATGVPHILEHTTLCGSEKYPIRDPFFKMLPRSLSNFMNAFTSSDHTTYPFATTNHQDFKNLLSVYLDATLHPLLKEEDFRQEGWRLGPENPRAIQTQEGGLKPEDIQFKGVVYNEMKGQMSDANYLYWIKYQESIFPAINNSGGDPQYITDLTHKQLVNFSKRNYNPSNAKILTYGDMPLEGHLEQIGEVLNGFTKGEADTEVKRPIELNGPVHVTVPGPIDTFTSEDKQFKTSTSWYMGDTTDIVESFSAGILSSLLLDGYGSPMYKTLIESGLGSSFTPNTGLDTSGKVPVFSIGATGVSEDQVPRVKEEIQRVFQESLSTGFSDEKVQGFLHQLELALRHKTPNFGIGIIQKTIGSWFNGSNPMEELAWNDVINEFKSRYAKGGYLESLLQKYLLSDNCLTFTMVGTPSFNKELDQKEAVRKEKKFEQLIEEHGSAETAAAELGRAELQLLEVQEKAQHADLSCLPSLRVEDIARTKERQHVEVGRCIARSKVFYCEADTQGLTYFQALHYYQGLPDDLRPLIPLFNDLIMRLGTPTRTMEQWEDLIKLKTGGVSTSFFGSTPASKRHEFREGLLFSGFALDKNFPDMLEILTTLVTQTDFNGPSVPTVIRELLRSTTNGALDSVAGTGHRYALNAAAARLSHSDWVQEETSGLTHLQATANLLRDAETNPESMKELTSKLSRIQANALFKNNDQFRVRLVSDRSVYDDQRKHLETWIHRLPEWRDLPKRPDAPLYTPKPNLKVLYDMPYQVYYSGVALPSVGYTHPASASLSVLSQLLTHNYLHPEIREKGGAYGAGASNNPIKGIFGFTSYRDPNPMNTLKVIQNSGTFARDRAWTDRELNEAKLSIFQGLDAPESVDEKGTKGFLYSISTEMEQERRERLLDVTAKDISRVADEYLLNAKTRSICVLGEKKDWPDSEDWEFRKLSLNPEIPEPLTS